MIDIIGTAARQTLRDPWSIAQQETPRVAAALIVDAPSRDETTLRGEPLIVRGGPRSRLAKQLNRSEIWGHRLSSATYVQVLQGLLTIAEKYQLVRSVPTSFDVDGWRLAANAVRLVRGSGRADGRPANPYFVSCMRLSRVRLRKGARGCLDSRAASTPLRSNRSGANGANGASAGEKMIERSLR